MCPRRFPEVARDAVTELESTLTMTIRNPWLMLTGLAVAAATAVGVFITVPVYIGLYSSIEDLPVPTRLLFEHHMILCLFPLLVPIVWLAWQRRRHPGLAAVVAGVVLSVLVFGLVYWAAIQPDLIDEVTQTEYGL